MKTANGWPVIASRSDKNLATGKIPGTNIRLTAHKVALPVLLAVAAEVHGRVHSITANNADGQDEAGYTYRVIAGTSEYSNHASGTAIDLNWRMWPMFKRRMTGAQRKAAVAIAAEFSPIITWGGEWGSRADEMHWEIREGVTLSQVKAWSVKHIGPSGRLLK